MPIYSNQQILRLQIAINDILLMDIVESDEDLEEVELGLRLCHFFDFFQLVEELSSGTI